MKSLCLWGMVASMLLAINANSQLVTLNQHPSEKPALFDQLPEKFSIASASLQPIFAASLNNNISISLCAKMKIEGVVTAKAAITPEQLSINIRCTNYHDALLNISRITEPGGTVKYIGRMVSPRHGDVLLLWEENGQYSFIRQKQLLTMVE